jgi:prevent-host-death family protein
VPIAVTERECKARFTRLLVAVERGETVVVTRDAKPIARLIPAGRRPPEFDAGRGLVEFRPGWDAPLTGEELEAWYGPIEPSAPPG